MKPKTHINDGGQIVEREMSDEEYAELLVSGWIEGDTTE